MNTARPKNQINTHPHTHHSPTHTHTTPVQTKILTLSGDEVVGSMVTLKERERGDVLETSRQVC